MSCVIRCNFGGTTSPITCLTFSFGSSARSTAGLTLVKSVDKPTALPGDVITYTVTYANQGTDVLRDVVIYDNTPAFTVFNNATNGTLPLTLTGVALATPSVGSSGAIKWTFTGTLAPASAGTVIFSVTVSQ